MVALTDEQRLLVDSVRDIASEFEADAFTWGGEVPWANIETLADHGFFTANIDEAYGGGGLTEYDVILLIEAVGRVCPDTAHYMVTQSFVGPRTIEMFGSEELKERYLPRVTAGESLVAIAISEPEAGSDVGNMRTRVDEGPDGDLRVAGEKTWVSQYAESDAAVVWAKFPEGIGAVLVEHDAPGVSVDTHHTNMAGDDQTHFRMNEVRVPEEHVLIRGRSAFGRQLDALNWERCGTTTLSNAIALCAFDMAVEYAGDRVQFDQPIGEFQGIRWKIADMAKRVQASRKLAHSAAESAWENDEVPDRTAASVAKLYSSEMVEGVVSEALQIHGANGYQKGHPIEYLYRAARGKRIAGGTDEVLRNTIADAVMDEGLPEI